MRQTNRAIIGADIHDGVMLWRDAALLMSPNGRAEIVARNAVPEKFAPFELPGGIVAPGFVDLQVNGGGGVMFNSDQSVDTLHIMAEAHARIGTAAFLPTLITDTPDRTASAIDAVAKAIAENVPGIIGIHLEGPHLSIARKGAHSEALIRPMTDQDLALYLSAADRLPHVMVTLAPENSSPAQIRALADAGVVVALGHTAASYDTCMAAFDAGARCATHLFNAMSQLGSRAPGLVGAALDHGGIYAGLIADGIHVHPATMRLAFAAEGSDPRLFLVSDAMASAGSPITDFVLNGRMISREEARLTLDDGTLAGADLELGQAVARLVRELRQSPERAVARATSVPAALLGRDCDYGRFQRHAKGLVHIDMQTGKALQLEDYFTQFPA